jgi:tetratricopeptide (TPR) repeat protein
MNLRQPLRVAGGIAAAGACLALAATILSAGQSPGTSGSRSASIELRERALDLAYNLDHDEAIKLLTKAVAEHPDDSALNRTLGTVLWMNILFRRGAVTVDHYLGSFTRSNLDLPKPDPETDRIFRLHVERAIALSEKNVAARPRDPQAHYDLGAAVGLQASYMATVEGRMLAGFKAARRCFDEHEQVLALDSSRRDARLTVGTYRYVVSTLSMPMRVVAYVAGFGGGRDRAIESLELAASGNSDSRTEAMFALILVYNREHRYEDGLRVLHALRQTCPRNRLVLLETGSTAIRAEKFQQANDVLTDGMAMLARDTRPRMPGEDALWKYKRGLARAMLGQTEAATADLRGATGPDSMPWVQGRARVELGQLALKAGDRKTALNEAQQATPLCTAGHDPICSEGARALARKANGR